jgi:4-amino-4-deoxy-L-arabinose transferase-like glycosyltransferase
MRSFDTRSVFIVAVAVLAVLAPFLNKAFHIDDPLFLWIAQQISMQPGDPYGFAANWYVSSQPMFSIMQNPPLSSYYMALMASFLGWSEPAMHGAFLVPAVAAVLGTFFLAWRFCNSPLLAALLLLFTPVFLVSATGVMCDVWLLALWVWSIECWLHGLEQNSARLFLLASILAAAAALTKYFGLAIVPLLAVYTLVRERRVTPRIMYLLIPILAIASYEIITKAKYGQGLFSNAMLVSWNENARRDQHFVQQLLIGLSFTGGCLFGVLFYAPLLKLRRSSREARTLAAESGSLQRVSPMADRMPNFRILVVGFALFIVLVSLFHFGAGLPLSATIEGALFVTIGIGILVLAFADVLQHKTADSLLLFLWVFGTFVFAAMMNWTISARTFLPMAPAVIIQVMRQLQRDAIQTATVTGGSFEKDSAPKAFAAATWWPILPAALFSLLITIGDYKLASTARIAASQFQQRFRNESGTVWFEGHWGLQYYMQQWRARPLDLEQHRLVPGDVLIVPVNNTNVTRKPAAPKIASFEQMNYTQFFAITMSREIGAGFYSSKWGPLPWAVAAVPPEQYLIFRIK